MMVTRVLHLAVSVARLWLARRQQRPLFLLAVLALSLLQPPPLGASSVNSTANSTTAPDSGGGSFDSLTRTPDWNATVAVLEESMNKSVDPCEDFYGYSCGNFSKTNKPQGPSKLEKTMMHRLKGLLEKPYNKSSDPTYFQNTKKFYQSCVGEDRLRTLGVRPLQDLVQSLGPWPLTSGGWWNGSRDLDTALVSLAHVDVHPLYSVLVDSDLENSSRPVISLTAGVPSIPVQYLLGGRNSTVLRAYEHFYRSLAVRVLGLPPSLTLNQALSHLLDFEIGVAQISQSAENTDSEKVFLDEMPTLFPKFNGTKYLTAFFKRANVTVFNDTVVSVLFDYVTNLTDLVERTDRRVVFNYLLMRLVRTYYIYLSEEFRDLDLPMQAVLYGVNDTQARWKTCVHLTNSVMGKAVGSLYVGKYFSPAQKKEVTSVVEFIRQSMKEVISSAPWIDNSTKVKALEKAEGIEARVGYPDYFLSCFVRQYSHHVVSGVHLDGMRTLDENIADNGGVKVAHKAFKKWEKMHGVQPPAPGSNMTGDQMFFISLAQLWCRVETDEQAKTDAMTSTHSPEVIRTTLVVSNNKKFAEAFNCPIGSKMNPKDKCELW